MECVLLLPVTDGSSPKDFPFRPARRQQKQTELATGGDGVEQEWKWISPPPETRHGGKILRKICLGIRQHRNGKNCYPSAGLRCQPAENTWGAGTWMPLWPNCLKFVKSQLLKRESGERNGPNLISSNKQRQQYQGYEMTRLDATLAGVRNGWLLPSWMDKWVCRKVAKQTHWPH